MLNAFLCIFVLADDDSSSEESVIYYIYVHIYLVFERYNMDL